MLIYPNTAPHGLKDLVLSAAIALPVPTPDRFLPKTLRLHTRMQTTPPEGLSQKVLVQEWKLQIVDIKQKKS